LKDRHRERTKIVVDNLPDKQALSHIDYKPPRTGWIETPAVIRKGMYCNACHAADLEALEMPSAHDWSVADIDWKLPGNWRQIVRQGLGDRIKRFRSFQVFMDICVRCGACADKCHFFIGTGDPKNMPVLRAELLRSVYRYDFTTAGRILGKLAGARRLTEEVIKEWWYYFFQCSECRRCSVFCPYGIDTAEITIVARELLNLLGLNIHWIASPIAKCDHTGNHIGIQPQAFKDMVEFLADDIKDKTGVKVEPQFNRKGADILFITPSGDVFSDPGTYTCMGYMMLFHFLKEKYGFDITWSTYASEGGNFGFFTSYEAMKRLNVKIYAEAKRLGVKWILGGECGHMWRVINQYMDTMNGPADFMEEPVNPITGTRFENAKSTKMVHIAEFTADLIKHGKLDLDPGRNDHLNTTYHDSCNISRGMGLLEEPRYILRHLCKHFHEMPEGTIREQTFCCGSGAGLHADEDMELRLRGGLPRANAVKYVKEKHGVNLMVCICAIDRVAFPALMDYWVPGVGVSGLHELLGNALIMPGEHERSTDLRGEALPAVKAKEALKLKEDPRCTTGPGL
jgi:Fe-S oxidoreductase